MQRHRFEIGSQAAAGGDLHLGWRSDACELLLEECEVWLTRKEKARRKGGLLEQHQAWVGKLLHSARGGTGMLHSSYPTTNMERRSTISRRCRWGSQTLKVEEKRQQWTDHWQVDTPEQFWRTPWKNTSTEVGATNQSIARSEHVKRVGNRGILGEKGAMRPLASYHQVRFSFSFSEERHE